MLFRIGNILVWKYELKTSLKRKNDHLQFLFFVISPPSGFERQFRKELPELYKYLKEAPTGKV